MKKRALILQDTYSPNLHFKTYSGHHIAFLLRQNGFEVDVIDRFGLFSEKELAELAYRYRGIDYIGVSATFMFKQLASGLNVETTDYNVPKLAKLQAFVAMVNPKQVVVGGATIYVPIDGARYVQGKNQETDIYRAFDIAIPRYISDIQTLNHRFIDSDYILPRETLPMEISRGCIFNCKFCSFGLRARDKFDYNRHATLVADEIEYNRDKFGSTNYYFLCDTFNDTTMKLENIANELSRRDLKISFVSYLRHDLLHTFPEQIQILKDMGIRGAQFGLETFNYASGKTIGKGLHPDKVKELLIKLNTEWPETMINSIFIVGLPHSTMDEHDSTVEWIKEKKVLASAMFYPLHLNKDIKDASEFSKNAEKYGYHDLEQWGGNWKYKDLFDKNDAVKKAHELNTELGSITNGSAWHLMPHLKNNNWRSIINQSHTESNYMDEYRSLLSLV